MSEALAFERSEETDQTQLPDAERCWMSLVHHRRPDGAMVDIQCDAYGDPNSAESYQVELISGDFSKALGQVVLRGGIYTTPDRRQMRQIEFTDPGSNAPSRAVRINLWDFETTYREDEMSERLTPIEETPNTPHLHLMTSPQNT